MEYFILDGVFLRKPEEGSGETLRLDPTYHLHHWSTRKMLLPPLLLALFFLCCLLVRGIPLSRDFRGGTLIQVRGMEGYPALAEVKGTVEGLLGGKVEVKLTSYGGLYGLDIEADNMDLPQEVRENLRRALADELGISENQVVVYNMGSILTSLSKKQARNALLVAPLFMILIVFLNFRSLRAGGGIVGTVWLNVFDALGCMSLLGVELSIGSMAGLLMLLGYSDDTNVLLVTAVEKGVGGSPRERAATAMRTGLLVNGTTFLVLLFVNLFTTSKLVDELTFPLLTGMVFDAVNTWFLNAALVLRKRERREVPVAF
ncbi:MAG: MMPL family transporter [Candidatus Hadarchaeales archaeon]